MREEAMRREKETATRIEDATKAALGPAVSYRAAAPMPPAPLTVEERAERAAQLAIDQYKMHGLEDRMKLAKGMLWLGALNIVFGVHNAYTGEGVWFWIQAANVLLWVAVGAWQMKRHREFKAEYLWLELRQKAILAGLAPPLDHRELRIVMPTEEEAQPFVDEEDFNSSRPEPPPLRTPGPGRSRLG